MLRPMTSESISKQINGGMKGTCRNLGQPGLNRIFKNITLALESGDFTAALDCAKSASKTIETHPDKRKSPHVLTLQADVNQLYGARDTI